MRTILVIAWWLLPLAFVMCAWFLHRQRDGHGVKAIAGMAVVVVAGFGVVAASFLLGAAYAPHGNANLSVALKSTAGCVFTPNLPNLRYYCPWPSGQFVLLPLIYLLLVMVTAWWSWRYRDRTRESASLPVRLFSISAFSAPMHRFLWPAIPIAFMWMILRNSPDLDGFKPLLVFLCIPLLLTAALLIFSLFARRFRLLPSLIGALVLLLLSFYFPIALAIAGFAPHGPEFSISTVRRVQTVSLALAYIALVLQGFSISAIFKIRKVAAPEHQRASQ